MINEIETAKQPSSSLNPPGPNSHPTVNNLAGDLVGDLSDQPGGDMASDMTSNLSSDLTGTLAKLVAIDSSTGSYAGIEQMQFWVADQLETMGFDIQWIKNEATPTPPLLIATLKLSQSNTFINFVGHSDTVLAPTAGFQIKGDRAIGSGVIDNKGGLVVALEGLRRYIAQNLGSSRTGRHNLRFVCSPNEETGSVGFTGFFNRLGQDARYALGFEPALENGSIIKARRGNRWYKISVTGQEAHAGRSFGMHNNAAHELAAKIYRLQKLARDRRGISVNIGHIEGGKNRFNIICGQCTALLDTRFATLRQQERLHRKVEKILARNYVDRPNAPTPTKTEYTIEDNCPPFSSRLTAFAPIRFYLKQIAELEGRTVSAESAGGAGDVNHMSHRNITVLDGLGAVGGSMHTPEEYVTLSSLESRSEALSRLLKFLNN